MRPALLVLVALAGCTALGRGPLPAAVEAEVDFLETRNYSVATADVAYDRAFDRVDRDAHVMTFEVKATAARPDGGVVRPALIDYYLFRSDAAADAGIAGLRRIHDRGVVFRADRLVLYVRGPADGLYVLLTRRFGTPIQV